LIEHSGRRRAHVYALFGYAALAVLFTWPLAPQIGTHLTGSPAGDTGVYVWNQWVFQHEILEHGNLPYFTDKIFSLSGRANLSLHNYTAFQDLVALPLMGWLGVVATFNVVYLLMTMLTGYATFLLARHVTGRGVESWLAGLLFAWSPVLATRGGGHFSLVAAAPLAIFLLLLLRTTERQRVRDALALGATSWWAASTDVYYAVYCVVIAALFMLARVMRIQQRPEEVRLRAVPWTLDVLLFCMAGLVLSMVVSGGWQFTILGRVASLRSLYTPMLLLTLLAIARVAWSYRGTVLQVDRAAALRFVRLGTAAAVFAAALLSPVLYAVGLRIADGRWDPERVFWRSSPRGVDLAAFVLPNPNYPLAPDALRQWLTPRPDAYFENVASLTFVALAVIFVAWRTGWRIPRLWGGLAVVFGALALGPFLQVAGANTHVPGPWAFLRYVPVIGLARTPTRFTVVLMLAVAILFAGALCWLGRRWPQHRTRLVAAVGVLLVFELLPAPRPLYSAAVPALYRLVAAAPDDVRVLELPFGVRDGTSSVGNFTARSQYFQTAHGKRLIGGYLSRVSKRRVRDIRRDPMLDALIWLSEGHELDPSRWRSLVEAGPSFAERSTIGFVVIDCARSSEAIREFAIRAFNLQLIEADGNFELYRPAVARPGSNRAKALPKEEVIPPGTSLNPVTYLPGSRRSRRPGKPRVFNRADLRRVELVDQDRFPWTVHGPLQRHPDPVGHVEVVVVDPEHVAAVARLLLIRQAEEIRGVPVEVQPDLRQPRRAAGHHPRRPFADFLLSLDFQVRQELLELTRDHDRVLEPRQLEQIRSQIGRRRRASPGPAARAVLRGDGIGGDVALDHHSLVRSLREDLNRRDKRRRALGMHLVQMPVVRDGPFQGAARDLRQRVRPAKRRGVALEELVHRRQNSRDLRRAWVPLLAVVRKQCRGLRAALMAGDTGHDFPSLELGAVDIRDHRHHAPRHGLFRLDVRLTLRIVRIVAVDAVHAERDLHQLHRRLHHVRRHALQHCDVLVELLCRLSSWHWRWRLRRHGSHPDKAGD
jgi:hypothetical protein